MTDRDEIIAARVMREREWAYAGWLQHKTWTQLRVEASRPEREGGLGYDLSIQALRGLVEQARADRGDLTLDRAAHVERELHDLDLVQQLALVSIRKATELGAFDVAATKLYLEVGERRRKLLGLDAATEVKVDVTNHDAVTEELNAMLARAGRPPIEESAS